MSNSSKESNQLEVNTIKNRLQAEISEIPQERYPTMYFFTGDVFKPQPFPGIALDREDWHVGVGIKGRILTPEGIFQTRLVGGFLEGMYDLFPDLNKMQEGGPEDYQNYESKALSEIQKLKKTTQQ